MKNIFDRYYKKYDAWYERNKFTYLSELEAIKKVLPKRGKGLEIGVGTGRFTQPLGIKYGIDPSRRMLEIAKKRGAEVRLGYGEKLPFKDLSFDYVAIIITLCFVKDPVRVLSEARRVLKKNGKIIIGIIDKENFLGKFYQRKKSIFYKQANFFSVTDIVTLLKTMGFSRFLCCQTIFDFPDRIKAIQKPKNGFGKGGFVVISAQKSLRVISRMYKKFNQYEKIRFLFKRYGYDMEEARHKVLERADKIEKPILDVGTGPGRMAYALANAGFHLISIDISKEVQKVAKIYAQKYGCLNKIKFMKMDAQKMKFKNNSFSTVISANLLHDVKHPEQAVQEIIRVVKQQGKIIISDLNKKGKSLVNKVYRINKEVHRGKPVDLEKVVAMNLRKAGIRFKKYDDSYITTYIGEKI